MAKRKPAEPKQVPRDLIITQCAYRKDSLEETAKRLEAEQHKSDGRKLPGELKRKTAELFDAGCLADILDCDQASTIIGVCSRRVRQLCQDGRLGMKMQTHYVIPRKSLEEFLEKPRRVGVPGQRAQEKS